MNYRKRLTEAQLQLIDQIRGQLPSIVDGLFETVLDKLAEPSEEVKKQLRVLGALRAGGVDDWEHYGNSLDDAGIDGEGNEVFDDEDGDGNKDEEN